jgi:hypothetical protein
VTTRAAVEEHVAAFNAWDTERLLAGFAPHAVWITGQDRFVGTAALASLFDVGLWALTPHLDVKVLVVEGSLAALEVVETLTVEGERQVFAIAAFLEVDPGGAHSSRHRVPRGTRRHLTIGRLRVARAVDSRGSCAPPRFDAVKARSRLLVRRGRVVGRRFRAGG